MPILLFWLALAAITNIAVPQLEEVGKTHNVALNSPDAPSLKAIKRIGQDFHEFDTDSSAMVVLEGDKPLGADAHKFYDEMIRKLEQDKKHVEHVQDFWGDTLTAAGSQSSDGKAAYVQVFLAGNQGSAVANEAVGAVRDIVDHTKPPPGVKAYVTGAAPLISDQFDVGSKGTAKVTTITIVAIAVMLFFVYRSILTTLLVLVTVLVEMSAARGIVAFLGNAGIIGLSTYATNLLTLLVIAAGTDYAIFFVGRYQEARGAGEDREKAFYTMFHGTAHIVLGFGSDRRRRGGLSGLYPAALLSEPGHSRRARHPRRARRRAHPGSGHPYPGRLGGRLRTQARDENPRLAADRHGHRPLARPRPRGGVRVGPGGPARVARIQDELRRSSLHARERAGQCRVHGRRAAFFARPAGARIAHGRGGSRPA